MDTLRLGKVTAAVGLKGELRVYPYTDYKEKFAELPYVLMNGRQYDIESVRYQKNMAVLKLAGISDRNAAEACRDFELFIARQDAPPLPEGSFYVADILGASVEDAADGRPIGTLKDVVLGAAQDLYEVETPAGKTFLIPAVEAFVKGVYPEEKRITVQLIEGMFDEN